MIKYLSLLLFYLCLSSFAHGQFSEYIVKFTDKNGTPFSINSPSAFLSQRAIERREKQHIPIDETDLPIVPRYLDSIRLAGEVTVLAQSKWLNQVCIHTTDLTALARIQSFSFVKNSFPAKRKMNPSFISRNKFLNSQETVFSPANISGLLDLNYGYSAEQIKIHHGDYLHDRGFTGAGMLIAILDGGFYHYKTNPAFDSLRNSQHVLDTYDFVAQKSGVNEEHAHGMYCFTIMAANLPGQMVGSCPDASYLLYRTEDVSSESLVEEQNWAAGAERSDSAGADIVTTSLGYSSFDNSDFDHSYEDMDGRTTIISRAAAIAQRKGMILLVAAGNDGNKAWHYIGAPADTDSILSVGAINSSGEIAPFSSYGPTADGRIKPTVVSVGWNTVFVKANGDIVSGNGTSFATPNMAGLVTCLWQAFPDFTSWEIMDAVKQTSSLAENPDDHYGFGIPDFKKAFDALLEKRQVRNLEQILGDNMVKVYPNPFAQHLNIAVKPQNTGVMMISIYDVSGRLCFVHKTNVTAGEPLLMQLDQFKNLQRGSYILTVRDGADLKSFKLIAQ